MEQIRQTLTLILVIAGACCNLTAQVPKSQDLEVVTALNAMRTDIDSNISFIQTSNLYALDILVTTDFESGYFYKYINPFIQARRQDLYLMGYVYVRVRFPQGKYMYSVTPGTKFPILLK